uniref:Uncharacterized protein n=1 Tax=Aplysina aerophoba bacterial symbiont clone AANRPS TaxID=1042317 RepID=F8S2Z8_9BACT|nr:hypothetical protein [Aplysina aerophoba bacterial symbiont clone AANRPS]
MFIGRTRRRWPYGVEVLRGDPEMVATVADSLEFEHKYRSIGDRVGARGPADRRRRGRAGAGPLLVDGGPAPGARRRCPRACHDCAVRPGDGQVEDPAPVRFAGHQPLVGVLHYGAGGGVEQWLLWVLHDRGAPATAYASGPLHVASADSRECRNRTAPACAAGAGPDGGGAETPVDQK